MCISISIAVNFANKLDRYMAKELVGFSNEWFQLKANMEDINLKMQK